jgi:hypothetical protein
MKREKAARCPAGFPQRIPSAFECDYRLFPKQSLMRHHAHENDSRGGERPLARVRFSINISGRRAGRPYSIGYFRDRA